MGIPGGVLVCTGRGHRQDSGVVAENSWDGHGVETEAKQAWSSSGLRGIQER